MREKMVMGSVSMMAGLLKALQTRLAPVEPDAHTSTPVPMGQVATVLAQTYLSSEEAPVTAAEAKFMQVARAPQVA